MGYIYKVTNLINGKVYIGLTQRTIQERWKEHINVAYNQNSKDSNSIFKKAIRKYGKENFQVEEIEWCDNLEQLKEKEVFWIKQYHSYAFDKDSNGYNSTRGGDYPYGIINQPVYQIDILTGKIIQSFNSIKEAEETTKAGDISAVLKRGYGEQPKDSGTTWVYQSEYSKYVPEQFYDKYNIICQLDLKGKFIKYWKGVNAPSFNLKISQGNISSCLSGNRKKAGEYQWCYYKDLPLHINKVYKDNRSYNKKKVKQYDLQNNFIKEWESATAAAKALGINNSKICAVCRGQRKTTGGFKWKYAD